MIHFHLGQAVRCSSAGATGSVRPRTGMAALVPIALPATEEGAGITCATKVSDTTRFPDRDARALLPLTPACSLVPRDCRDAGHERSGEASGASTTSHHRSAGPQTQTVRSQETCAQHHRIPDAVLKRSQQHLLWYK